MSKLLSELAVGTKVKFGKYQVNTETPEPIVWVIAAKNHTGYPANSITLHTPQIIDFRCLDALETHNLSYTNRNKWGNNRYSVSNMDQWLNSSAEAGKWYTARHQYDMPPTSATVGYQSVTNYQGRPGFLKWFTLLELNAILTSTIRVGKCTLDGGDYEDIERKVFLPALYEVGLTKYNDKVEGTLWDYYSTGSNRIAYPSKQSLDNSLSKPPVGYAREWWTRTPSGTTGTNTAAVTNKGFEFGWAYDFDGSMGVRPACNVSGTLKVGDTPDSDGCYTIDLTPDPAPTPTATFTATSDSGGILANVTNAMKYSVDGGTSWLSITGITVHVTGVTPENEIKVKQLGNGTTTLDSEVQVIRIMQRPTPALVPNQPTAVGGKGSIPLLTTHEYSTDKATWVTATGTTELAPGTYYVRVKAAGTVLASPSQTIVLTAFTGTPEPTPKAVFTAGGYASGMLTNVSAGMKFSVDAGVTWKDVFLPDGSETTHGFSQVTPEDGVQVKKCGNGTTTTDSAVQTIAVTRQPTPALVPVQPTVVGGKGSIPTTVAHMWGTDKVSWVTAHGAIEVAPGTYYIETIEKGTALTSDPQTIVIEPFKEPVPAPTPTPDPDVHGAYVARDIKDRIAIGDDCFKMEKLEDGRVKLTPAPDSIAEAGTDVNRALLQLIENRVVLLMNRVFDGITSNPFIYTFGTLSGMTVTGVWNEKAQRIEC